MKTILFLSLVIFLFIGCEDGVVKEYYKSGELKKEVIFINDSIQTERNYYRIKNLKSSGNILNGQKDGFWQEWYPDGSIKWEGKYFNGTREIDIFQQLPIVTFETKVINSLTIDSLYRLRISLKGLHPQDMVVACVNGVINIEDEIENYDFRLMPNKKGKLKLRVYAFELNEEYFVGEKSYIVN